MRQSFPHARLRPSQQALSPTSFELYASIKDLVFTRSKVSFWKQMIAITTSLYRLPQDAGETSPDIPEFSLDRSKALKILETVKSGSQTPNLRSRFEQSLSGQMQKHFRAKNFGAKQLRQSYVGDLDAGQQRAFIVDENKATDSGGERKSI